MQFQAAYFLESLKHELFNHFEKEKADGLLRYLSYFEADGNVDFNQAATYVDPVVAVVHNLVCRGLPTQPSIFLEEELARVLGYTEKRVDSSGAISYPLKQRDPELTAAIIHSLHIIEPRLNALHVTTNFKESWEKLGSRYEKDFLARELPHFIGSFFIQLLETHKDISTVVNQQADFTRQPADFAIEFPYLIDNTRGLIIEVDGLLHKDKKQVILDQLRDHAVETKGWAKTLRISTENFGLLSSELSRVKTLLTHDYFKKLAQNYRQPLFNTDQGLDVLQLSLTPVAVARIHRVLVELMVAGKLRLDSPQWNIIVVEQDVPCARLAIDDFRQWFENLFALEGKGRKLPPVNLTIITTRKFETARLNRNLRTHFSANFVSSQQFDLLIDMAVLQRKGVSWIEGYKIQATHEVIIRSVHAPLPGTRRFFRTAQSINYSDVFPDKPQPSKLPHLEYFLQNLFRKKEFREHQAQIVAAALQNKTLTAGLPSNGGKTLSWQLAAMLQPGIAAVLVPTKPLALNQAANLRASGIDACLFIDSQSQPAATLEAEIQKIVRSEALFAFMLPRQLLLPSFVKLLLDVKTQFSYGIIEEADAVSEWSDNFRMDYYNLPRKVARSFSPGSRISLPLMGFSSAVSGDVWADINRAFGHTPDTGMMFQPPLSPATTFRSSVRTRQDIHYQVIHPQNREAKRQLLGRPNGLVFCPHTYHYFGTGIEKPNLQHTVHIGLPGSPEAFTRQSGRLKPGGTAFVFFDMNDQSGNVSGDALLQQESHEKHIAGELLLEIEGATRVVSARVAMATASRKVEETRRALVRLGEIGMVADFSIDVGSNSFEVFLRYRDESHPDNTYGTVLYDLKPEDYEKVLFSYLCNFLTPVMAKTRLAVLADTTGNRREYLQQCLDFYLSFVYRHIKQGQQQAKQVIHEGFRKGILYGSEGLKHFLDVYTTMRYVRRNYVVDGRNYSLSDRVEEKQQPVEWLWQFIAMLETDRAGSPLENLRHVLHSCEYLLGTYPQNPSLLLLKAFALFVLDLSHLDEAKNCFFQGLLQLRIDNVTTFGGHVSRYKALLLSWTDDEQAQQGADQIINLLNLQPHLEWLKNFNATFLAEYDR